MIKLISNSLRIVGCILVLLVACKEESKKIPEQKPEAKEISMEKVSFDPTDANVEDTRYHISFEDAELDEKLNLKENGNLYYYVPEGVHNDPVITHKVVRKGKKAMKYSVPAGTFYEKQRAEHSFFHPNLNQPGDKIENGEERYTGFSFNLAKDSFPAPKNFLNLHQIKQVPHERVNGPSPFIQFGWFPEDPLFLSEEEAAKLQIQVKYGRDSNHFIAQNTAMFIPERGVWYDCVIGYKFSPVEPKGWMKCWIKKSTESEYTVYTVGPDIRVGYKDEPYEIYVVKWGYYHGGEAVARTIYFDEIRYSNTLEGAVLPERD